MKSRLFTLFAIVTAVLVAYGLYQALVVAPTEKTMGDIQRIFYIHVPSAWVAFVCFFLNFCASILYLVADKPGGQRVLKVALWVLTIIAVLIPIVVRFIPQAIVNYPYFASMQLFGGIVTAWAVFLVLLYFGLSILHRGERATALIRYRDTFDALGVATAEVGVLFCTIVLVTGPMWARYAWGIWWTWDVR